MVGIAWLRHDMEGTSMKTVTSRDGTIIAYDQTGEGPLVVLVNGAMGYREHHGGRPLAAALADAFTVITYDRRGRGASTDTPPYAVEREVEDIEALVSATGGTAFIFGASSGAVLALKAAARLGPRMIERVVLYEPPFNAGDEAAKQEFAAYARHMEDLLNAGQRGDAVAFFLADMLPVETIAGMRQVPGWGAMEAVAPTLAHDNAVLGDGAVPIRDAGAVMVPALILSGSESPPFFREVAVALAHAASNAGRPRPRPGQ
jgi:pimeloyl-ACP methyl ester carboxylesterase